MPFTPSYSQPPSPPHLCEIISLYPEDEPFCAGYAPSRGRRCRMRTSAWGRTSAMAILNRATKSLRMGQMPSRDVLVDLAHYTLCTRFHQDQAEGLAMKWQREIERFLDEHARSVHQELAILERRARKLLADSERRLGHGQGRRVPTPGSISMAPTTRAQAPPWTQFASAPGRLVNSPSTTSATNNLPVGGTPSTLVPLPAPAITNSQPLEDAARRRGEPRPRINTTDATAREVGRRELRAVSEGEGTRSSPSPSARRSFRGSDNAGTQEAVGTTRATTQPTTRTTATSTISSGVAASASGSTSNDSMAPAVLNDPRRFPLPASPSRATPSPTGRTATRRTIEGDCVICFESLRKTRCGSGSRSYSNGEDNKSTAGPGRADGEALRRVNSRAENDGEPGSAAECAELSWCKAHCGVNYHTTCIRQWLAAAGRSTCPTCRGIWRDEPASNVVVA
ncbi:hypothetical protein BDV10DRAFT_182605 [Aspergillus recurvatus]